MTRNRRPSCGHQGDEPFYGVASLSTTAQDHAAMEAALDHLAHVLNLLPSPIEGALAGLAARDISVLLISTPLKKRGEALRKVGIPVAPRTVGQALCQDVLTKLERVHLHDVWHFAHIVGLWRISLECNDLDARRSRGSARSWSSRTRQTAHT